MEEAIRAPLDEIRDIMEQMNHARCTLIVAMDRREHGDGNSIKKVSKDLVIGGGR